MLSPRGILNGGGIDETSRFVRGIVNETEEHMLNLRNAFSSYLRHEDMLHQKVLKLATVMRVYAERETTGTKACLLSTADGLAEVEKTRKEMLDRINLKSREPLGLYGSICDGVLDDLKVREIAIRKEYEKQLALDRLQVRDTSNRTRISQGQIELSGANHEANTSSMALAETIERFEQKKIGDIKSCLQEFIYSQMSYNAKSLEVLTELMAQLNSTDFDIDLEEICEKVRPPAPVSTLKDRRMSTRPS